MHAANNLPYRMHRCCIITATRLITLQIGVTAAARVMSPLPGYKDDYRDYLQHELFSRAKPDINANRSGNCIGRYNRSRIADWTSRSKMNDNGIYF